jgi:hypothetical protein
MAMWIEKKSIQNSLKLFYEHNFGQYFGANYAKKSMKPIQMDV